MIEFARTHIIGRSAGHSAVKAAAYRSGTRQHDQRIGLVADYTHRVDEVVHSDILLPAGAPEMLHDRSILWNEIELAEDKSTRRATAQLAKDHIIALPRELSLNQQVKIASDFAHTFVDQGVGVDLNVHMHSEGNPHAHLMTTTRVIDETGIGGKARHLNGSFIGGSKLPEAQQLRHRWADFQNQWCVDRDIDLLVTNNDGQWQAQSHHGPKAHMVEVDNPIPSRESVQSELAEAIQKDVEVVVDRVVKKKAVFTAHDLYRELHQHIDKTDLYDSTKAVLDVYLKDAAQDDSEKNLVLLGDEVDGKKYYTTRNTLDTEMDLVRMATTLFEESRFHDRINPRTRESVISKEFDFLSEEQSAAVDHITGSERLSVVVGFAGAGKSTMLKAAKRC